MTDRERTGKSHCWSCTSDSHTLFSFISAQSECRAVLRRHVQSNQSNKSAANTSAQGPEKRHSENYNLGEDDARKNVAGWVVEKIADKIIFADLYTLRERPVNKPVRHSNVSFDGAQ